MKDNSLDNKEHCPVNLLKIILHIKINCRSVKRDSVTWINVACQVLMSDLLEETIIIILEIIILLCDEVILTFLHYRRNPLSQYYYVCDKFMHRYVCTDILHH